MYVANGGVVESCHGPFHSFSLRKIAVGDSTLFPSLCGVTWLQWSAGTLLDGH